MVREKQDVAKSMLNKRRRKDRWSVYWELRISKHTHKAYVKKKKKMEVRKKNKKNVKIKLRENDIGEKKN